MATALEIFASNRLKDGLSFSNYPNFNLNKREKFLKRVLSQSILMILIGLECPFSLMMGETLLFQKPDRTVYTCPLNRVEEVTPST